VLKARHEERLGRKMKEGAVALSEE
jgi:hypothetical protein